MRSRARRPKNSSIPPTETDASANPATPDPRSTSDSAPPSPTSPRCPHVHVCGDLAELQLILDRQDLPDHVDPQLAAYRKLRGFVRRVAAGGAWSLSDFVRSALRDIWRSNADFKISAIWSGDSDAGNAEWQSWLTGDISRAGSLYSVSDQAKNWKIYRSAGGTMIDADAGLPIQFPKPMAGWSVDHSPDDDLGVEPLYRNFSESTAIRGLLRPSSGNSPSGVTSTVLLDPGWPCSLSVWPTKSQVKIAVRFVEGVSKFKGFQELWDQLAEPNLTFFEDEWLPLEKFLDREAEISTESRAVLLVDPKWESRRSDESVGYLVIRTSGNWDVWMSGCTIVTPSDKRDGIQSQRTELRLDGAPAKSVFGFPVSGEIVALLKPDRRPIESIARPLAIVTTVKPIDKEDEDPLTPVQAIWNVAQYGKDDSKIYRLKGSKGYDLPPNWVQQSLKEFEEWRASHPPVAADEKYDSRDQKLTRAIEWGLSRQHKHAKCFPQWFPPRVLNTSADEHPRLFEHLVLLDLNFGFRRHPFQDVIPNVGHSVSKLFWTALSTRVSGSPTANPPSGRLLQNLLNEEATITNELVDEFLHSSASAPDWWYPLIEWALPCFRSTAGTPPAKITGIDARLRQSDPCHGEVAEGITTYDPDKRGWLVCILGRQLPLTESNQCHDTHQWDRNDLWDLLLNLQIEMSAGPNEPTIPHWLFRDRTIVVVSGHLLRANGAKISHRLSWEHTALDCVRELEDNPRFRPLSYFRHVIVRFGCAGAVYLHRGRNSDGREIVSKSLFFDATAKSGFHRDPFEEGQVLGNNSIFAARILQHVLEFAPSQEGASSIIRSAIRQAIIDCQLLHKNGYGNAFSENDGIRFPASQPFEVLFNPLSTNK